MIYLDNAATTKIDPEVLEAMMPYLTDEYGNAGGLYDLGFSARKAIDKAREQVADFIGADSPEQIIFTSGGSESNNTVFYSYGMMNDADGKRVIVSSIEHESVLRSAEFLNIKLGFDLQYAHPDKTGLISPIEFNDYLLNSSSDSSGGLVSVMCVNNEIGSTSDIKKICDSSHENGFLFHTDCVQAAGIINNVSQMEYDFVSLSGHKIHAPKGIGVLYVRDPLRLVPMIKGGLFQEYGKRGGTENIAGIVGLGAACKKYSCLHDDGLCNTLKKEFWDCLNRNLVANRKVESGIIHDNALSSVRPGKILSVRFDHIDAESLILMLGTNGVCASAGSACTSREQKPSHVLKEIGLTDDEARNTVRFSFSRMNTKNDVLDAAWIVADCVKQLYHTA